jgi:hypothetical protein
MHSSRSFSRNCRQTYGSYILLPDLRLTLFQVSLDIPYAPAFSPDEIPVSLPNLHFERCCLLFNLASLYSQLGLAEDRTTSDGVKRASAFYQVSLKLGNLVGS